HGVRLAVPRAYFFDMLDEGVRARFDEAAGRLRAAGVHIDEIAIHHTADIATVYLHIVLADAAAYHAATLETMPERYTPNVRIRPSVDFHSIRHHPSRVAVRRSARRLPHADRRAIEARARLRTSRHGRTVAALGKRRRLNVRGVRHRNVRRRHRLDVGRRFVD